MSEVMVSCSRIVIFRWRGGRTGAYVTFGSAQFAGNDVGIAHEMNSRDPAPTAAHNIPKYISESLSFLWVSKL